MTQGLKMSNQSSSPIVNNAKLPSMDEVEQLMAEESSRSETNEMQASLEHLEQTQSRQVGQSDNFMEVFQSPQKQEDVKMAVPSENVFEPQQEARTSSEQEYSEEGYIRLQLHVENGEIQIIGAHSVEGPLLQEESLFGEFGFEMRLADRRLALGSIPDVGELRSFPPPYPTEGLQGHYIDAQLSYGFTVRIPREHFTEDNVNKLEITVFRKKGDVDLDRFSIDKSVLEQSGNLRNVACLTGISEANIANDSLQQINTLLQRTN